MPAEETDFEIGHFRYFRTSITMALTLDRATELTVVFLSSTSTCVTNFTGNRKIFIGRTNGH